MEITGREAARAWIRKNQCPKCIYAQYVHHALEPFCNYAVIKGMTRTMVALEMGERLEEWEKCKLFKTKKEGK